MVMVAVDRITAEVKLPVSAPACTTSSQLRSECMLLFTGSHQCLGLTWRHYHLFYCVPESDDQPSSPKQHILVTCPCSAEIVCFLCAFIQSFFVFLFSFFYFFNLVAVASSLLEQHLRTSMSSSRRQQLRRKWARLMCEIN